MSIKNIKIELPMVLSFRDYHEIDYVKEYINILLKIKIKAKEIGCNGEYQAIFYLKKDKEYDDLVKDWKAIYK